MVRSGIVSIRKKVKPVLHKYKIKKASLFGSYARGEQGRKSDVDILVELSNKSLSLVDFIRIKHDLEAALGKKVDLVEYKHLRNEIKKKVQREMVKL